MPSNWTVFRTLCRILGGRNSDAAKHSCLEQNVLPRMIAMAEPREVLPALAVRCFEHAQVASGIGDAESQYLRNALLENTRRNMQIVVQAIKLVRTLNAAGINPLLLKGTAQLLTVNREQPGFRQQADIDLIVPPESLVAAGEALRGEGYRFYRRYQILESQPGIPADTGTALSVSAAHHHLPPLVKSDRIAFVELHRHFLPKRFQHGNPLQPLFDTASEHHIQGASFLVPATEYQIIHIVLGRLIHDGYLARREFPLREACDYIELMNGAQDTFDSPLVEKHCGAAFGVFDQLVRELMGYQPSRPAHTTGNISRHLWMMRMRYNFSAPAALLDIHARASHLAYSMRYSPSKLSSYLAR